MSANSCTNHRNQVDLMKVAEETNNRVSIMLSQGSNSNIIQAEDISIENLPLIRASLIDNLPKALATPIEDVLAVPAESIITTSLIADNFEQEAKELTLLEENLSSNVESLYNFNKNFEQRNDHLNDIVEGARRAVNAIEDEDLDEELMELETMKRNLQKALKIVLESEFQELKDDLKSIIQGCMNPEEENSPYMALPEDVDLRAVMLLQAAEIIEDDEENPAYVKLFDYE